MTGSVLNEVIVSENKLGNVQRQWLEGIAKRPLEPWEKFPSGSEMKSAEEQVRILVEHFPRLDVKEVPALAARWKKLPPSAVGLGVFPKVGRIPTCATGATPLNAATSTVHAALASIMPSFCNMVEELGDEALVLSKPAQEWRRDVERHTPGDVLVLPVRFADSRERQRSLPERVTEIDLTPFEVGCLFLSHREWLSHGKAFWLYCAGAEMDNPQDGIPRLPHYFTDGLGLLYGLDADPDPHRACLFATAWMR